MKKSLAYLLILVPLIGFSQDWKIPQMNWHGKTETENVYIDLLNLKDGNSLIVKVGYSSYWSKGINSEFIVYQNDGKVKRYIVYQPNSTDLKTKIKRKRIKKTEYKFYWNHLLDIANNKMFQIDKSKLNIITKPAEEKGMVISMSISDGTNYHFQITQGKNYIAYASYEPKSFIEDEFTGWEERQKLVDLMNGFEKLTEKY
tara:strand:+ start:46 stop:648 length:603 start_codon:yes stop_codon:yes gene_type:complete